MRRIPREEANGLRSRFEKVVVIGWGKTAADVLNYVTKRQDTFVYRTLCIECETHGMSKLHAICDGSGAEYAYIPDKKKALETIEAITEPALVISAGNTCLFPKRIIEKENLEIINFHSALLPEFPGRNAQSWAIWEGEKTAGATWHYIESSVDTGDIIAQRETPVTEDMRAYELTRDIMEKASEAFTEFYDELLIRHIEGRPQPKPEGERKIYYSWELPGGGVCSVNDPPEQIYRMLRAMDYGKNDIFPPARIRLADGRECEIMRYMKRQNAALQAGQKIHVEEEERRVYLALNDMTELMIKYKLKDQAAEEKSFIQASDNLQKMEAGGGPELDIQVIWIDTGGAAVSEAALQNRRAA